MCIRDRAYTYGLPVDGTVAAVVKGGVEVTVSGVRAFCPISQIDNRYVEDAAVFVGQRLAFRITRFEEGIKEIVFGSDGETLFLRSVKEAPRGKVLRMPLDRTTPLADATVIVPEGDAVIEGSMPTSKFLLV